MEAKLPRPLSIVRAGEKVKVVAINAGHGLNSRLASLGILPNVEMTVLSSGHLGPFVVSVKDSRMVLGRGMADKIMVL
jgi:Fe2+ transport system protein FeoA